MRRLLVASSIVVASLGAMPARAEPTLRTPKKWGVDTTLPVLAVIDPYVSTWRTMQSWVMNRELWQRNDLLVTLLHDDQYLTIESAKLSIFAPGAMFFVGPAGNGSSGTVFALRVPF